MENNKNKTEIKEDAINNKRSRNKSGQHRSNSKDRNRSQSKEERRETGTSGVPSGLIAKTIASITSKSTAISSILRNTGATTAATEMTHAPVAINVSSTLFNDEALRLVKSQLQSVINAYSVSRGYQTEVTTLDIANYLDLAADYFSNLVFLHRIQNSAMLTTVSGRQVGQLFSYLPISPLYGALDGDHEDYHQNYPIANFLNAPLHYDFAENISNATWVRDIVSHLPQCLLPTAWFEYINYIFSNVFTLNGISTLGFDSFLSFMPSSIIYIGENNKTLSEHVKKSGEELATMLAEKPDLKIMLELLGFNNSGILYDFTRDLKAKTLSVVDDKSLLTSLIQGQISTYTPDDKDGSTLWRKDDGRIGSVLFGFEETHEISAAKDIYSIIFSLPVEFTDDGVNYAPHLSFMRSMGIIHSDLPSGKVEFKKILPPARFTEVKYDGDVSVETIKEAVTTIAAMSGAMDDFNSYIGFKLPFSEHITLSANQVGLSVDSIYVTASVVESADVYIVELDDLLLLKSTAMLAIMFGSEWRMYLQTLLQTMTNGPLTGAVNR